MLSAFQILAKKVPSSLRVSDLRGIQNNPPRGGEYRSVIPLKRKTSLKMTGTNATNFDTRENIRIETNWKFSEFVRRKFASILVQFLANCLFSTICIVFAILNRQFFFHFFPNTRINRWNCPFPRSSIIPRTLYTRTRKYNANLI